MEQHVVDAVRLVGVVFVKEFTSLVFGIDHFGQLFSQGVQLLLVQQLYLVQVAMLLEVPDLFFA